ncbi:ATP-binding protein [Streptomyces sp. NPDC048484]|uniref:ATP-binding protein n=1 Tax=Streptomyces sp. NPDC048484 TaxID=3155146 RepID=UPI00341E3511
MALSIPTDRPLRSPRQLLELAEAIRDAGEHDENDWIEWKSSYDLTTKEVKATIARHIIGMANRMPEKSSIICHGYGYIAIGVEPKNVEGVISIDLADLDSGLQSYLGHHGPEWSASYVSLDGKTVLMITVEPPKIGDQIHTLHKEFGNYIAGMIFVRRTGRTMQANPGEVLSLTRRATQSTAAPQNMTVTSETEPVKIPLWKFDEYVDEITTKRKEDLNHPQNSTRRRNNFGMDNRTEDDYKNEVAEHLEEYRDHLENLARQAYVRGGGGALELTVSNPDQVSHQGVRVELSFPTWLIAILAEDYEEEEFRQPRAPEPLGTRVSALFNSGVINSIGTPYHGPGEMETSIETGLAVFNVASVRAEGQVKLPKIHFIADSWAEGEGVATWAVTALNSGGRAKGSIQLTQVGVATVASRKVSPETSD